MYIGIHQVYMYTSDRYTILYMYTGILITVVHIMVWKNSWAILAYLTLEV